MKIKSSAKFHLETRYQATDKGKELITENVPIFLFFNFDGKQLRYYTGYRIDRDKWDQKTQKVKRNVFNKNGESATDINSHLREIETHVTDIYTEQKARKKNPTVSFVRDELKKKLGETDKSQVSIFIAFELFIAQEAKLKTWTEGTKTKLNTVLTQLKDFYNSTYKFDFETIDETFLEKYIGYQQKTLELRNVTIAKNLKIFNWFMNWATRKKFNSNLTYKTFDPNLKGTNISKVIFLEWPELMKVYEKDIPKPYLARIRDVFCFQCFTGLRYSDVYNLKKTDIKGELIEITTIKTEDPLQIDLNDYSRAILAKYKDEPFPGNKALPVISNQKFNEYLKELGQFCELTDPETLVYFVGNERKEKTYQKWELLTTHVGRKTFISNALFFNIPAEVIMAWTGHKDHKVMEKYYKIIAPQKKREMAKFSTNGKEK
jgi:integrase